MINKSKGNYLPYIYISWLSSIYYKTIDNELYKAIKSIENQECKYKQEIIIVKDGDINKETNKLLNNYDFKIPHKIIKIDKNKGLGNAMKVGSKYCRGKYIARFDVDDINLKNRLQVQIPHIEKDPRIAVISCEIYEFNEKGEFFYKKNYRNSLDQIIYKFNPINHPTTIINKELLLKVGNYNDIKYFEDYYLWLKFIKHGYKIKLVNEPLVLMKVNSSHRKRWGFKYSFYEILFTYQIVREKLINYKYLIFFIIRIISRLIPLAFIQIQIRKKNRILIKEKII